jgi:hypothetical protein
MTFSLVPGVATTNVILAWHKSNDSLVSSLLPAWRDPSRRAELLNQFAFYESEDTCINPELWEAAPPESKTLVLEAMRHEMFRSPEAKVPTLIQLSQTENE